MLENVILNTTGGTIQSKYFPGKGWKPVKLDYDVLGIRGYEVPVHKIMDEDSGRFIAEYGDYIRNYKIGPTIAKQVAEGYNPVITHGTDTLAKTAGVVNYNLCGNNRRVVFTGALYPPEFPNFDGEANRGDAVVFAKEGDEFSGTFIVMGGKVLYPDIWGKHKYRLHDPAIEMLRLGELKGFLRKLDFELHEPSDAIANVSGNKVFICQPQRLEYDETTYLKADGYFSVTYGGDGIVRHLDFRGDNPPYTGKVAEINEILNEYARLKGMAWNYPEKKDEALSKAEDILRRLRIDKSILDKFTAYWKKDKLKPHFDPTTNLGQILIADTASDPEGYIPAVKDEVWKGIVIRGLGFGNVYITHKWKKLMKEAQSRNVPVVIVTDEGIITSKEYEVSRPSYDKYRANHSGTLNAEEAQIRVATGIGDEFKVRLISKVAEIFRVKPLDVFSAFYVPGSLFKDAEQRAEWERVHKYSTNPDIAVSPLFEYEEKIMLSALNHAYVLGTMKKYKIKRVREFERIVLKEQLPRPSLWDSFRNRLPLMIRDKVV
ncbi:MAG: asparaginase domain-containing protein [Candidatus Aenigmarchaeota archaeon]|nr:asparaginase domain-containing protein [Candidatus Aenigmarchaeota archaeon]